MNILYYKNKRKLCETKVIKGTSKMLCKINQKKIIKGKNLNFTKIGKRKTWNKKKVDKKRPIVELENFKKLKKENLLKYEKIDNKEKSNVVVKKHNFVLNFEVKFSDLAAIMGWIRMQKRSMKVQKCSRRALCGPSESIGHQEDLSRFIEV